VRVGLGISLTNIDSQWNPFYKAFHRIRCCKLSNWSVVCKRDLDAVNMRPALKHVCVKQTLSARKLFFRANLPCVPDIKM